VPASGPGIGPPVANAACARLSKTMWLSSVRTSRPAQPVGRASEAAGTPSTTAPISPSVRRQQLAVELRMLREAAELTHADSVKRIGQSRMKITRLENEHTRWLRRRSVR
jgi:hypothetical protein